MSTTITVAFIKQFEREVHEAFQRRRSGILPTVRRKPNVVGTTTTFQKVGKGAATTKSRHGLVTPMNVVHTNVEATMVDFFAGDFVDKLDEAKINIDERRVLSNAGANALNRKIDQQLITELDATTQVGTSSAAMTIAKIDEATEQLHDNDVFEDGQMWGIVPANGWNDLMAISQFASADFITDKPNIAGLRQGKFFQGINWFATSALLEFKSGSTFKGYIYHEDAVGYGNNAGITTDITWNGERVSHFVNHFMAGGAALIDTLGVFELNWT